METLSYGQLKLVIWDLGGQESFIQEWPSYVAKAEVLIYVIDSADHKNLEKARTVFEDLVRYHRQPMCAVLVVANKQDLPDALSPLQITSRFRLNDQDYVLNELGILNYAVFGTSTKTGYGLPEFFNWLYARTMVIDGSPNFSLEEIIKNQQEISN